MSTTAPIQISGSAELLKGSNASRSNPKPETSPDGLFRIGFSYVGTAPQKEGASRTASEPLFSMRIDARSTFKPTEVIAQGGGVEKDVKYNYAGPMEEDGRQAFDSSTGNVTIGKTEAITNATGSTITHLDITTLNFRQYATPDPQSEFSGLRQLQNHKSYDLKNEDNAHLRPQAETLIDNAIIVLQEKVTQIQNPENKALIERRISQLRIKKLELYGRTAS